EECEGMIRRLFASQPGRSTPNARARVGIQSASSVKQANFLSGLLHKSPIFCPKNHQMPTNFGRRPENGRRHLTLRKFEHEISNLAPGGWRVPWARPKGCGACGQNKDNRK